MTPAFPATGTSDSPRFPAPPAAATAIAEVLRTAGLPDELVSQATLTGAEPVVPSSFAVGTAAQAGIAAAALAASAVGRQRGQPPQRGIELRRLTRGQRLHHLLRAQRRKPEPAARAGRQHRGQQTGPSRSHTAAHDIHPLPASR